MNAQSLWLYYQIAVWAGTWVIAWCALCAWNTLERIEYLLRVEHTKSTRHRETQLQGLRAMTEVLEKVKNEKI